MQMPALQGGAADADVSTAGWGGLSRCQHCRVGWLEQMPALQGGAADAVLCLAG